MEEQKKGFEEEAMKYVDWGNEPAVEEELPKEPEEPAPAEEEQPQQEHEETDEEMRERMLKEQEKQLKRLKEEHEKAKKRVRENMAKLQEDMAKSFGGNIPINIDMNQLMDDMMNLKEEDIITPESDALFFAWLDSRFPGLKEEAQKEILKKQQKEKEEQEKYMQQVSDMFE